MLSPLLQIYQEWQDRNKRAVTATTPQMPPLAFARLLQFYQQLADRDEQAARAAAQVTFVPFEWFEKASQQSIQSKV
jgi:hypothetical protein